MDIRILFSASLVGYLTGSILFAVLIPRLAAREKIDDVEMPVEGTQETYKVTSMGATTASMKMGGKTGCLIGWLDIFKVMVPTAIYKLLYPAQPYFLVVAVAGMLGHNWPVFFRFKGGRGISAFYGGFIAIDWLGALVCSMGGLLAGLLVFKDFVLAYMAGVWLAIPWLWFRTHDPAHLGYAVIVNVLFVLAMIPDLRQYLRLRGQGSIEMRTVMNATPMGRGMLKIMEKLNIKV